MTFRQEVIRALRDVELGRSKVLNPEDWQAADNFEHITIRLSSGWSLVAWKRYDYWRQMQEVVAPDGRKYDAVADVERLSFQRELWSYEPWGLGWGAVASDCTRRWHGGSTVPREKKWHRRRAKKWRRSKKHRAALKKIGEALGGYIRGRLLESSFSELMFPRTLVIEEEDHA